LTVTTFSATKAFKKQVQQVMGITPLGAPNGGFWGGAPKAAAIFLVFFQK